MSLWLLYFVVGSLARGSVSLTRASVRRRSGVSWHPKSV